MKDINGVRRSAASNLHLDFMALTLELNMFFLCVWMCMEKGGFGGCGGRKLESRLKKKGRKRVVELNGACFILAIKFFFFFFAITNWGAVDYYYSNRLYMF